MNLTEFDGYLLFADGSSLGNPGPGGWGTVLVLPSKRVMELGAGVTHTTNNRMELTALIEGLKRIRHESGDLIIFTDSRYVENGATKWIHGWKNNGWVTGAKSPVENRELWEMLHDLLLDRKKFGTITWQHVPGHSGVAGNERYDEIATGYARGDEPGLFEGELGDYAVDILNISIDEDAEKKRSETKSRSRQKAYSYLSLVDGVAKRHLVWADCEARVRGKSGAKYKKALSQEDERHILALWGSKLSH